MKEKKILKWYFYFILLVSLIFPGGAPAVVSSTQINIALSEELTTCYPEELLGLGYYDVDCSNQEKWLAAVYHDLGIQPLWVNENGPTDQGKLIFAALKSVGVDGLRPDDYGLAKIASLWESRRADHLARLDIDLTLGLSGYIHDMQEGRLAPRLRYPKLFNQAGNLDFDPLQALSEARSNGDMAAYLAGLAPGHRHYRALKKELEHYKNIAAQGGWPTILPGNMLYPNDSDNRIPSVRQLLKITGDLTMGPEINLKQYDDELVAAVKKFQARHGLQVDGIIGRRTIAALAVPVEKRIEQILINMERWRWIEHELGLKYVLVDIAGFNLQGVVDDITHLEMRVIVGKRHHETPVFSDTVKYIEFNPFWNITPGIARNEMLEKLRKNSDYLASKHIRLFSSWHTDGVELDPHSIDWSQVSRKQISRYKLRQDPGSWNALGVVKFVFPNKYSVYLHDTPVQSLFEKNHRAFSHGCIRLSEPEKLAEFLLAESDAGWSPERIEQVIESGKRKIVRMPKPIPVHLVYQTAWVDKNGALQFSRDLYGRDRHLTQALFGDE